LLNNNSSCLSVLTKSENVTFQLKKYATIIILFLPYILLAQLNNELYISSNIQKTYIDKVRLFEGIAGEKYWINHSNYQIKVKFNPYSGMVTGKETITYFNESPDTLKQLVIRLYQNIFNNTNPRDFQIDKKNIHNGVKILQIDINGKRELFDKNKKQLILSGTNLFIKLSEPFLPKDSIDIKISWNEPITLPTPALRMGKYDSTTYHIAYWYPQIAVYDDIDGWDKFDYTGIQEFYNDFSNFNVEITVPENFIVWATGTLQNAKDVFQTTYYNRYLEALKSNKVVHIITEEDLEKNSITKNNEWNTYKFSAEKVPDFAFSVSDHFLWDLNSITFSKTKQSSVLIGAVYKNESKDFYNITEFIKRSIKYFSTEMPAVEFPYPSFTLFNGSGAMEFPMMANESNFKPWSVMSFITSHEISHTYFPFLMGINERKYAWMDEGWATMLNLDFRKQEVPNIDPVEGIIEEYLKVAGSEFDIPSMVLTKIFGSGSKKYLDAYENSSYYRPAVAYYLLEQMLGHNLFLKALKEYMRRWRGKHPTPYDFFFTFNNVVNENLNWFWQTWFFDFAYCDLGLELIKKTEASTFVEITNKGKLPVPVVLNIFYADGSKKVINKSMRIWKSQNKIRIPLKLKEKIIRMELGNTHIPDIFSDDNIVVISLQNTKGT